jgi:hypothetical protein
MSGPDLGGETPLDDDTGALLSAYLDGEVTPTEAVEVRSLLERSALARTELESLQSVRATLRDLPEVAVPAGFFDDPDLLLRPRRHDTDEDGAAPSPTTTTPAPSRDGYRPRATGAAAAASPRRHRSRRRLARGLAALGVAAVAVALLVGITPVSDRFVPPVNAFAARHQAMERGEPDAPNPSEMAFADMPDPAIDAAGIPATMAGDFERVHGFVGRDGMVHAVFSDGEAMVSVYEQTGAVAWGDMPPGATAMDVAGAPAMGLRAGAEEVVVVDRGGRVYTVVSGGDHDRLMAMVLALPDRERSMMDRVRDGCRSLVGSFAADG